MNPRSILIADPDLSFLESIVTGSARYPVRPIIAKSGKEAQLALTDTEKSIAGVFVNLTISDPNGFSVIRCSRQNRPTTPVILLNNGDNEPPSRELKALGIQKVLKKPVSFEDLVHLVIPRAEIFDPAAALAVTGKYHDRLDSEVQEEDAAFSAISASGFLGGSKSLFDVYVRLLSSRYVKILQAGDAFSPERVDNYLKKGVTHFYVRKEAHEHYLTYTDKLASSAMKKQSISSSAKLKITLAHGEETMRFFQSQGLSESNLSHAQNFIENSAELCQQLKLDTLNEFSAFISNIQGYKHGVATAMVASLVAKALEFTAERTVRIVGLACMFHDIGLYRLFPSNPEIAEGEDVEKMTPEQKSVYVTHPQIGVQILKTVPGIEETVLQAVAKHHERRGKQGFPPREPGTQPHRVAEIVGISDEFVRLVALSAKDPALHLKKEMEWRVFNGFSYPVCTAFKSVFFPG